MLFLVAGSAAAQGAEPRLLLELDFSPTFIAAAGAFPSARIIVGGAGVVFWTSDGGTSWTTQEFTTLERPADAVFIDDSVALLSSAMGGGFILRTAADTLDRLSPTQDARQFAFARTNGDTLLASGIFGVSRSNDFGQTWSDIDSLFVDHRSLIDFSRLFLPGPDRVVALSASSSGGFYRLYFSVDGGRTWPEERTLPMQAPVPQVYRTPAHYELIVNVASFLLLARRHPNEEFELKDPGTEIFVEATTRTSSGVWGVGPSGLARLDEENYRWVPVDANVRGRIIAATDDGTFITVDGRFVYAWAIDTAVNESVVPSTLTPFLYPDPTTSEIVLRNYGDATSYDVYDMLGRMVDSGVLRPHGSIEQISVAHLAPAMYVVVVRGAHAARRSLRFARVD